MLPALLAMGLGFGMIFAPAINTATAGVPPGPQAATIASTRGYTVAFTISAALLGLGAILAILMLPSRHRLAELTEAAALTPARSPGQPPRPSRRSFR